MSGFLTYIHNLRGAAILFIVGVHARGAITDWASHPHAHHFFELFFDAREGNGTVMFLFISGFLFQYLTRKNHFDYPSYLQQKFKVIILPYIFVSIPIILLRIGTNFQSPALPADLHSHSVVYQFFFYLFTGTHMAPFWFIATIVLFYLTAPGLHALDNKQFYNYVFPFIFVTCLFTYRPLHNANPFLAYLHYLPVFLLGMFTSFYKDKILTSSSWVISALVIVYMIIPVLEVSGYITLPEKISFQEVLYDHRLVFNSFMFRSVVLCFIVTLLLYRYRHVKMPLLELLGDYSFGIFFVHFILINICRNIFSFLHIRVDFSLITFSIYFLFILLGSISLVYFIKKLTGRYSRNLIGS